MRLLLVALILLLALTQVGCQSAARELYYDSLERLGTPRRELLSDRVEKARESQEDAKEQFASALDEFQALTGFDGGELERTYRKLEREYERAEDDAEEVRDRIEAVENAGTSLFNEWEEELDEYSDPDFRRRSEDQLDDARDRYDELIAAMRRVERTMEPVLSTFRDHVLFLKHNLNAQAIASLEGEVASLQTDVDGLIADMEEAIAEANAFIEVMG
ncbi:MAG: DUF2959 domain-containing protein [Bacteroidota bacterium]